MTQLNSCNKGLRSDAFDIATIPGLRKLWALTLGDPRVRVAVLDGPVDLSHPVFAGAQIAAVPTLVPAFLTDGPAALHGTHVTSIIFAQGNGCIGIAPRCSAFIVPIYRDGPGRSMVPCSHVDLARALLQAAQLGANIVNISGGHLEPSGTAHPILADAIRQCAENGILIVAATGNEGCECLNVPAALPSVLAVGAMTSEGEPLELSNWGDAYRTHGVLAPGQNILGAAPGGLFTI